MAKIYANNISELNFHFTEKRLHLRFQEYSAEVLREKTGFSF